MESQSTAGHGVDPGVVAVVVVGGSTGVVVGVVGFGVVVVLSVVVPAA